MACTVEGRTGGKGNKMVESRFGCIILKKQPMAFKWQANRQEAEVQNCVKYTHHGKWNGNRQGNIITPVDNPTAKNTYFPVMR